MTVGQTTDQREADVVATLALLTATVASEPDTIEVLRILSESCARILDADAAGVSIHDDDTLRFVAASSEQPRMVELLELDGDEGPCHQALVSGRHATVSDARSFVEVWPRWTPRATDLGIVAVDAFPLRIGGIVIGVLSVYAQRPRRLAARDLLLGQAFADAAAVRLAIQQAISDQRVIEAQLRHALTSRVVIEQAKGTLAERHDTSVDRAYEVLRQWARGRGERVADVARAVIAGELDLSPIP